MAENMNKYLISGIPPSDGGVGRLMVRIVSESAKYGFTNVIKKQRKSARKLFAQKRFMKLFADVSYVFLANFLFYLRCFFIKNSIVLFVHPQTAGFSNLLRLAKRNKVYLYIMDNSFFCIQSYNFNPCSERECCKCIGNVTQVEDECNPFPVRISKKRNIEYLKKIKENADALHFLAQNVKQKEILELHLGDSIWCRVVGMDTGEFSRSIEQKKVGRNGHIVYHGSLVLSKGVKFFTEIASLLPEYAFFIPLSKEKVENLCGNNIRGSNIVFKDCTWETGLREAVIGARLVVNPSLWSAPIEGALLKSILYNGNVATVKSKYGFESEIADCQPLLRLENDKDKAAKQIRDYLKNRRTVGVSIGMVDYLGGLNKNIFDVIK